MPKYRNGNLIVEAVQTPFADEDVSFDSTEFVFEYGDGIQLTVDQGYRIDTPTGEKKAAPGDWLIRHSDGALDMCDPDVFEVRYDEVED